MLWFFNTILYEPLLNALIFLYDYFSFHDLGIAIILLTILIRLILFPLFHKGSKDQAIIQRLAPKIKEIQHTHKHDKEKQAKALMDLYKEHKINPFSGFLLLLVQLPILFALYKVFLQGLSMDSLGVLYTFVPYPASLGHYFLGIIDLTKRNIVIALLAAAGQYVQGKLAVVPNETVRTEKNKSEISPMETMQRQMVYLGPALTFLFLYFFNLPAAIGLYWLTTVAFSIIQQIVINKSVARYFEGNRLRELASEE